MACEMKVGGQFPGHVVVRFAAAFGKILRSEQIDSVVAIRLIETNDVGPRGIISFFEVIGILRAADFDVLRDEPCRPFAPREWDRPDPAGMIKRRAPGRALCARSPSLFYRNCGAFLWRCARRSRARRAIQFPDNSDCRATTTHIARTAEEWAIPFAGEVRLEVAAHRFSAAVAKGFVAAADAVVVHGHGIEIKMAEGFAEIPGGDAGHAHGGHGLYFVKTHFQKFGVGDGIDVGVVRAGAVPGHQEGHAFVQVMDDGGMPFVKHAVDGFGGFVSLLMGVAIDVHEGVFGPVRRRHAGKRGAIGFAF